MVGFYGTGVEQARTTAATAGSRWHDIFLLIVVLTLKVIIV